MSKAFDLNDIPKYKKKKKNNSSAKKRSDHKHQYEKIIVEDFLGGFCWGERCKICGRIVSNTLSNNSLDDFYYKYMNALDAIPVKEIHKKFPQYKIYVYKRVTKDDYDLKGKKCSRTNIDFNSPMEEFFIN